MTSTDLLSLWIFAIRAVGFHGSDDYPPAVQIEPDEYFEGNVWGIYQDDWIIHIRADVPDSVIVHEFVHATQPSDMPRCEREIEAYRVQNEYMVANGESGFVRAACPKESEK